MLHYSSPAQVPSRWAHLGFLYHTIVYCYSIYFVSELLFCVIILNGLDHSGCEPKPETTFRGGFSIAHSIDLVLKWESIFDLKVEGCAFIRGKSFS